jgi:hypothetical protein
MRKSRYLAWGLIKNFTKRKKIEDLDITKNYLTRNWGKTLSFRARRISFPYPRATEDSILLKSCPSRNLLRKCNILHSIFRVVNTTTSGNWADYVTYNRRCHNSLEIMGILRWVSLRWSESDDHTSELNEKFACGYSSRWRHCWNITIIIIIIIIIIVIIISKSTEIKPTQGNTQHMSELLPENFIQTMRRKGNSSRRESSNVLLYTGTWKLVNHCVSDVVRREKNASDVVCAKHDA